MGTFYWHTLYVCPWEWIGNSHYVLLFSDCRLTSQDDISTHNIEYLKLMRQVLMDVGESNICVEHSNHAYAIHVCLCWTFHHAYTIHVCLCWAFHHAYTIHVCLCRTSKCPYYIHVICPCWVFNHAYIHVHARMSVLNIQMSILYTCNMSVLSIQSRIYTCTCNNYICVEHPIMHIVKMSPDPSSSKQRVWPCCTKSPSYSLVYILHI